MHAENSEGVNLHFSGEAEDLQIAFDHKILILTPEKCLKK